jgi:L-ascorbate metabolism protein UlaG (beta-lactamase superfamily)
MRHLRKIMITTAIILSAPVAGTFFFMQQEVFGKNPSGQRLERIKQSPNYQSGSFRNVHETFVAPPGTSYTKMMWEFMFDKSPDNLPKVSIPSVHTDLKTFNDEKPAIIWFGHSSYLIKSKGVNILVDPVFSGNASPVSIFGKAFNGSDAYSVDDMPEIDICIVTHDHYDHLDYRTIKKLSSKVKMFYTALGVGTHLEAWGIETNRIVELDWWEDHNRTDSIKVTATPARHFSGRGLTRAKTLWASYVLELHGYKIFVGGDSGYDDQFKLIGERFGPFDIAMLECGQYGKDWPDIHMTPEESAQAAKDLQSKMLLPVHWSKFSLALHAWNEPITRLVKATSQNGVKITTPLIGQPVILESSYPDSVWWNF